MNYRGFRGMYSDCRCEDTYGPCVACQIAERRRSSRHQGKGGTMTAGNTRGKEVTVKVEKLNDGWYVTEGGEPIDGPHKSRLVARTRKNKLVAERMAANHGRAYDVAAEVASVDLDEVIKNAKAAERDKAKVEAEIVRLREQGLGV